jgi:hypothetical protein
LANRHIGNQGGFPLRLSSCEDIKHLLFTCIRAKEIWDYLGLSNRLYSVIGIDRSSSVLLGEIITRGGRVPSLDNIGFAEIVLIAGWYIW